MNKIVIDTVIFSYNRAMQLDAFLSSLKQHAMDININIHVLHRPSPEHELSYRILKDQWPNVIFHTLVPGSSFTFDILPKLRNISNLYRFFKYPYIRKLRDDFKSKLENILATLTSDWFFFCTDDTYYYRPFTIPTDALKLISSFPSEYSLRLYVGANLSKGPVDFKHLSWGGLLWNYYHPKNKGHWAYPFSVDGTIYHRAFLIKLLSKFIYHMPSSLEAIMVSEVRRRRLFQYGICLHHSCLVHLTLNTAQDLVANPSLRLSLDDLNALYLDGYRLKYIITKPVTSSPLKDGYNVVAERNNERLILVTNGKLSNL